MSFRRAALALGLLAVAAVVAFEARRVRAAVDYPTFADPHPSVLVTDPRVLLALEDAGFSLASVLGRRTSHDAEYEGESAADLWQSPVYADFVRTLTADLAEFKGSTRSIGVGPRFRHRLFDVRWLTSALVHYELVGVVNRLDFRELAPPGCGQTRLVYRIAYHPPRRPLTRLPLTLSVLYENQGPDCAALAREWLALESQTSKTDLAGRLAKGPFAGRDLARFDRIETNLQSLREDSIGRTMDDHGEYILRSFLPKAGHLVPAALRNTIDPNMDEASRAALVQWISANVAAIDAGSAEVPERFLATRAISLTPRGLARTGNRPYKTLFPDERGAFADAPLSGARLVTTPEMLVRRLDEMTCPGCHEARAVAGFHLLGEERSSDTSNSLTLGTSEQLRELVSWRFGFVQAVAAGHAPPPAPLPEHVDDTGAYGARCTHALAKDATTGDDGLPDWTCAPGLACRASDVAGDPVGSCATPAVPYKTGDACERVETAPETPDTHDGDLVKPLHPERCDRRDGGHCCHPNEDGFPGGMCTSPCTTEGEEKDGAICMRIPHKGFEKACFKEGVTLEKCLQAQGNFAIERMKSCSRTEACRDDFVCTRVPGIPVEKGACVPPYFLFEARVDGPPVDR